MEETREFELAQVKAVRFKGTLATLTDTDLVSFKNVKKLVCNDFVSMLKGTETKYIGYVSVRIVPMTKEIKVAGLLDYASPERLLLENGELSLDFELALGDQNDFEVKLDDDGKAAPETLTIRALKLVQRTPGNLQLKEMSWEF